MPRHAAVLLSLFIASCGESQHAESGPGEHPIIAVPESHKGAVSLGLPGVRTSTYSGSEPIPSEPVDLLAAFADTVSGPFRFHGAWMIDEPVLAWRTDLLGQEPDSLKEPALSRWIEERNLAVAVNSRLIERIGIAREPERSHWFASDDPLTLLLKDAVPVAVLDSADRVKWKVSRRPSADRVRMIPLERHRRTLNLFTSFDNPRASELADELLGSAAAAREFGYFPAIDLERAGDDR